MNHMKFFACFSGAIWISLLLVACGAQPQPTVTVTPTRPPTVTPSPTPPPPEHRIAIRQVGGVGEFYDRLTGEKFLPRGNNYIRLAPQVSDSGEHFLWHSTFDPDTYDAARAEAALERMASEGYNLVRVLLNTCCGTNSMANPSGGLSSDYVANLVDFLRLAKEKDIYVQIELGDLPKYGGYTEILDQTWSAEFAGNSASILRPGGVRAFIGFIKDFIRLLIQQQAPLDAILAYQLSNEFFYTGNLPPFSLTSGIVHTANGSSYDLSSQADKQRMMDEGLVYWIDTLRAAILEVDPTALVTIGFFVPQEPHPARPGDTRLVNSRPAIWESSIDYIDLHPYPGAGLTLQQYVDNFGMQGLQAKPIIMGEFGAARYSFPSEAAAARALHDWQVESCNYGFDGWMLWTYDCEEQTDFFNGLTGEGLINQVLAPVNRPDPCLPGHYDFFAYNLALGKPAVASRSLSYQPPSGAVDGELGNWWGAGAMAPQWIQVDLGEPVTIKLIRLIITQSPSGETSHQIWVGSSVDQLYRLHIFEGYTEDNQVLEYASETPLENVRFIRVITTQSPSWVGWKEIEILAP